MSPRTLPELWQEVADANGSRPAIVEGGAAVSYRELLARVLARAGALRAEGVRAGDAVALLLPNGLDYVVGYLAVVALGAAAVPLNDRYRAPELRTFLHATGARVVVTSRAFAAVTDPVLAGGADRRLHLVEDRLPAVSGAAGSLPALCPSLPPDAPVMFQFSSGSTGAPKRIARSHAKLLAELASLRGALRCSPADRFLGAAPFSHVNGLVRTMLGALGAGAALFPMATFARHQAAELIARHSITVFIGVPFMFAILAQSGFDRPPDFSSLRLCVSASAPMPPALGEAFRAAFGLPVRQLYGSTETGSISANLDPDAGALGSVGRPLPGVELGVFREDGAPAAPGELGEFAVRSAAMIDGYDGLPGQERAFRGGWFWTGDLGRKDAEGRFTLEGRKTFFINRGGFKVNPREIEEALESHPLVEEAVALGVRTAFGDERIKAFVVPRGPCTEAELVEHCRGRIADFKVPSVVELRESLPKSPTGKVRRALLG